MIQTRSPILVTGAHRTGTTWVGRMLAADNHTTYISEPLNILHRPGVFAAPISKWYTYISDENENLFLPAYRDLLLFRYHLTAEFRSLRSPRDIIRMMRDLNIFLNGNFHHQRALLKDPFAVFSLKWFAERLDCRVLVIVRHPAGFASSLARLHWPFNFRDLLDQPLLMRDWLESERAMMQSMKVDDILGQAGLLWRMIYRVVHTLRSLRSDVQVIRHEDLSRDPVQHYRQLYAELGLVYNDKVKNLIVKASSPENPADHTRKTHSVILNSRVSADSWKKRLSAAEISRVRKMTEDVAQFYYSDAEWA